MQNRLIFTNKYGRHSAIFNPLDLIFAGQMYLGYMYPHTKNENDSSKDKQNFPPKLICVHGRTDGRTDDGQR